MTRLYAKYEISYAYNSTHRYYDKLKQQYQYARENLESMRRASGDSASGDHEPEGLRQAIISRLIIFAKNLLYLGFAFFIFALIFKNVSVLLFN